MSDITESNVTVYMDPVPNEFIAPNTLTPKNYPPPAPKVGYMIGAGRSTASVKNVINSSIQGIGRSTAHMTGIGGTIYSSMIGSGRSSGIMIPKVQKFDSMIGSGSSSGIVINKAVGILHGSGHGSGSVINTSINKIIGSGHSSGSVINRALDSVHLLGYATGSFNGGVSGSIIPLIPNMTSDTTPSGIVSSSDYYGSWYDYLGFNTTGYWGSGNVPPNWLQYQFTSSSPLAVSYQLKYYDFTHYSPQEWYLYGSNDGSSWTVLDHQLTHTGSMINFSNSIRYSYYRLTIISRMPTNSASLIILQIYGYP